MGPTTTSTRISPWVCGTCSLLRCQVDHCIIAQALLLCSVCIPVWASCHLTYVSIRTARDAVVGLSAINCFRCIHKNPLCVGISSASVCLQVIHQVLRRPAEYTAWWRTPTPSICASNAPCRCIVISSMTIFPLPDVLFILLMMIVPAIRRFHHTRHSQLGVRRRNNMNAPDYAIHAILTWARAAIADGFSFRPQGGKTRTMRFKMKRLLTSMSAVSLGPLPSQQCTPFARA